MPGDARGTLSRWIQRRSAILAVIFAVVLLPVLPTGAATWAAQTDETTSSSSSGGSQPEPAFSADATPNPARPGDSVEISISSPDPLVVITSCTARFPGGDTQNCVNSGDVWSVTLQVPADAAPQSMLISAILAYSDNRGAAGGQIRDARVTVPFTIALPTTTSDRAPTTTGPSPTTTGVPPTTAVPPTIPGPIPSPDGTSILWIVLVVLVLVLLALAAALVGRRSPPRPQPAARVQARLRDGPPPVPRIEQISKRPAWVLRIDPHGDRATERIEEMQR